MLATALALVAVQRHEGLYYSQADVHFLAPSSQAFPNSLTTTSGDIIKTAGVVASLVNGTEPARKLADASATLVGRGVVEGWSVTLPDTGGQWAPNFPVQLLNVQVAGGSAQTVLAEQERLFEEISDILLDLQEDAGVAPVARITTLVDEQPTVHYMGGQPKRALLVTAALGGLLTMWSVLLVEQVRHGQREGRRALGRHAAVPYA